MRALEPYREAASPADPITGEWIAALEQVGRTCPPVTLSVTGLTLTASGVMAQAEPVDDGPWELMRELRTALGDHAWFEDQFGQRDIWYSSILHFAAPVLDPAGMVDWVRANRASLCHEVVLDSLTLTRFRYRSSGDRHLMAMEPWHAVALEG